MTVIEMKRHTIPDMQSVQADIERHLEPLESLVATLEFVQPVDKVWLAAAKVQLAALERTLKLAVVERDG